MNVYSNDIDAAQALQGLGSDARKPASLEEAAEQFEHILVKQMVQTMTKDLFDGSLAGDDAPQWMGAYDDIQSDVLATELAKKMTESGRLGIAELLMKKWTQQPGETAAIAQPSEKTHDPS